MTAQESTHTGRPTIVEVSGVSKRFTIRKDNSLKERIVTLGRAGRRHREDFWALDGVDLTIEAGTTIGLIGHNGSGKSTLLKVIGGIIDPTLGSVSRRGRIAALLELGAGFHPDLTGRENVFLNASILGLSRDETEASFDSILDFSGIGNFIDTQVKFYSSGMYVRLAFAVAIHTDPDLLLVDEVLAVGDEAFQRKCLDKIREFQHEGRTIVLVSHSLGQVIEMCDRAVLLNQGKVVLDGDPREAVADFRDILEGRRIEGERSSGQEQKRAAARSTATRAFAVGREEGETIQPGDDLVIEIDFVSDIPLEGWLCGIQIDNELGQVAYSTSNKGHKLQLRPLVGERTVRLVLPHVALNGGKYFVNASLIDSAGQHLHDIPQATSFNVKDDGRATGILYSESELIELP